MYRDPLTGPTGTQSKGKVLYRYVKMGANNDPLLILTWPVKRSFQHSCMVKQTKRGVLVLKLKH